MARPTVAERIDPNSPHYDAAFAELRRKAVAEYEADREARPERYEAAPKR